MGNEVAVCAAEGMGIEVPSLASPSEATFLLDWPSEWKPSWLGLGP